MVFQIYCDGGSRGNPGPAASAFVIFWQGRVLARQGKFLGVITNNQAEYQAVILALSFLQNFLKQKNYVERVEFFLDSELVVKQLEGIFKIRDKKLQALSLVVKRLEKKLDPPVFYKAISRSKNKLADRLVNQILDQESNKF